MIKISLISSYNRTVQHQQYNQDSPKRLPKAPPLQEHDVLWINREKLLAFDTHRENVRHKKQQDLIKGWKEAAVIMLQPLLI